MRALLIVLDSVGIGDAPDAESYGDAGANTLGHILEQRPQLALPNLCSLGLMAVLQRGGGSPGQPDGLTRSTGRAEARPSGGTCFRMSGQECGKDKFRASYGRMQERSAGKDTTTGHWELAGALLDQPFATFERFPEELVRSIERDAGVEFIGNYASSGTTVLEELGAEHVQTGKPILYTSADSVLQIAAHEEVVPIERLYKICKAARIHADGAQIGRVIARPFLGEPGAFKRTSRRHDYSMKPPRTVLDAVSEAGFPVIGVGKISDIFAGQGVTESLPTATNAEGMARIDELWSERQDGLIFANLVDFDMLFGHRRDVRGYANALEEFDAWLGTFLPKISRDDLVIITADHGNDPTFRGTDHTREQVPLFVLHGSEARDLGTRETFADVAATLADHFGVADWRVGTSFLRALPA